MYDKMSRLEKSSKRLTSRICTSHIILNDESYIVGVEVYITQCWRPTNGGSWVGALHVGLSYQDILKSKSRPSEIEIFHISNRFSIRPIQR